MRKFLLLFLAISISHAAMAQPGLRQRLYYTAKVWGFVKYYHSAVSTCSVNWDSVLLHTLPLVRNATSNAEFNDALDTMLAAAGPMALSTTYFPDTLPPALKRNRDWAWINAPIFRPGIKAILDTIKNNFRPHMGCRVDYNSTGNGYNWGGYLNFMKDSLMLGMNIATTLPSSNQRQLLLFKAWNVIRYFNPYNYVLDVPCDSILANCVLPMDTASTTLSYYHQWMRFTHQLDDAHVEDLSGNRTISPVPGLYTPRIRLKHTGGEYVVIKSLEPGIVPGDVLVSADGKTVAQLETELSPFYSYGSEPILRRTMCFYMLGRLANGTIETLVITDSTGTNHTFNVPCVSRNAYSSLFYDDYYPADSLLTTDWTIMPCDIGYINIGNITSAEATTAYATLQHAPAIIIDIRNYPIDDVAWTLGDLMYPAPTFFSKLAIPDVQYPGTYFWEYDYRGVNSPAAPYAGPVIVLVDEQTQSAAEYSTMILKALPNCTILGSHTAGADGNVTWLGLSNDQRLGWTSMGVYYPNGDSTQRIGIVPDTVKYLSKEGIRHNRDELLEKALDMAGCALGTKKMTTQLSGIAIYPNPAADELHITATQLAGMEITVTLTSVTGSTIMQTTMQPAGSSQEATLDIKSLPAGIYLAKVTAGGQQYVAKVVKK